MSVQATPAFLEAVRALADELPVAMVDLVAAAIAGSAPGQWADLRHQAQRAVPHPGYRGAVGQMIDRWRAEAPALAPASVALALQATACAVAHARHLQTIEVVWTGPESTLPLRRTAQALQEVINEARRELLVVSYAVYDIPEIGQALAHAVGRGVRLRLVVESAEAAGGHMAYNQLAAFGAQVQARAQVFRWPAEQRPVHAHGRSASLHVKCAVADEHALLLSSANLTHYALNLNMEMGLLIRGGEQPRQVARHFRQLMDTRVLVSDN